MYCDHANLIKVFDSKREMKQHVRGKLQRWSFKLAGLKYEIEHIKGEDNVWADIVSRWGPRAAAVTARAKAARTRARGEPLVLRSLQDEHCDWPTVASVAASQQQHRGWLDEHGVDCEEDDGTIYIGDKLWIPAMDKELVQRLLVVAHCGSHGHRGEDVMVSRLDGHYHLDKAAKLVHVFISKCLLCKHIKGGKLIQRPWSTHSAATTRNEVLHMDYLFMGVVVWRRHLCSRPQGRTHPLL